jgi:hypothetical protein
MPGLTVTEKSHWRDRIAARIDRAIERVKGRHPALFDRLAREAHARALTSLGLESLHADLEAIRVDEATLARRKKLAQKAMIAALRSIPIDDVADTFGVRYNGELALPHEAAEAITRRQAVHRDELLADDPIGREVTRLEAEKDHLLDTVWLAVSPTQIKQLWSRISNLLGDEPTTLEREALAIEPAKEE